MIKNIYYINLFVFVLLFISCNTFSNNNIEHFMNTIDYCNKATKIINKGAQYEIIPKSDVDKIAEYFESALVEGSKVNINDLNKHYPDFGTNFQKYLLAGLELYIDGYNNNDAEKMITSQMMMDKWAIWYDENIDQIRDKK